MKDLFSSQSPHSLGAHQLLVDVPTQFLYHLYKGEQVNRYSISTAANGVGEKKGSFQTPRGWHIVRAKIGQAQPENTIFVGRRPAGIFTPAMDVSDKDWILTRILWLSGLEVGKNRLGDFDSMQRYIYIHGCPDSRVMGVPHSKGCIRMRNQAIIELFDIIPIGTKIFIQG